MAQAILQENNGIQVLLYDGKEMHVFDVVNYLPQPVGHTEFDVTTLDDMFSQTAIIPNRTFTAELTTGEMKAELDPTTMKRIAKYNLDKDFEELNRQIKSAEDKLKFLNEEMKIKYKKLERMQNICQQIWNDDYFDENDYTKDEDNDYDDWEVNK